MIIDIPTKEDFFSSADDMVNEAWEKITNLAEKNFEFGQNNEFLQSCNTLTHEDNAAFENYWNKERPKLISALTLILQSVEFRLKGMIADISPYLLLSSSSKNIPNNDNDGIISFAQFRSVDAQDLIKVYETFGNRKLSSKFKKWYEDIRILRNRFMHTVDKTTDINAEIIFKSIIIAHQEFNFDDKNWLQSRLNYLSFHAEKDLDDSDLGFNTLKVHNELYFVAYVCSRELTYEIFKLDKSLEKNYCKNCIGIIEKYEYFDSRYLDYCIGTIQKNKRTHEYMCIFCGFEQTPEIIK